MMSDKPDPSLCSVDHREGEYTVQFAISGTREETIQATNPYEAHKIANAVVLEMSDNDFDLDDIDVSIDWVKKAPPMYRVTRNGKMMQTSYLRPGDLPRDPDEQWGGWLDMTNRPILSSSSTNAKPAPNKTAAMQPRPTPIYVRIPEARALFGVSRSCVYEMRERGEFTIHKRGKTSLLKVEEMILAIEGKRPAG